MSSILALQFSVLLLLGALVVEKMVFAITRAVDGYEDDTGFHWDVQSQPASMATLVLAPI